MKVISRLITFSLLTYTSIFSQQTTFQDSLMERMVGHWTLNGIIAGQETTHDISAAWVLDHQYLQIKEVSKEKDDKGNPAYEALVYIGWDSGLNQYACLWLDNTGGGGLKGGAIAHANRKENEIAFLFKVNDKSNFHTTFVYDRQTDTWQWIMNDDENGKIEPFARVKLTRKL